MGCVDKSAQVLVYSFTGPLHLSAFVFGAFRDFSGVYWFHVVGYGG